MRGVLATLAAALGFFSVSDTLANVVVKGDAAAAYSLAPWDGVIAANLAQTEMSTEPVSGRQSHLAQLAREAIILDATAVEALDVLGLQAQLRGETGVALNIFSQSMALSRRELRPQIWAIEEAVSRGDIDGALHQYDIALRTSRRGPDMLFPVLASAISEPKVRTALIRRLRAGPIWNERFITYVGRAQIDPVAAVSFFREGERLGLPIKDSDRTAVVNALARRGKIELAWDYYSTFRSADNNRSRDAKFTSNIEAPAVFDWTPHNAPGISGIIQQGRDGGVVDFSAAPSVGGVVLEQLQVLAPGRYSFESTVEDLEQPERSKPYWVLSCQSGQEIGRIPLPNAQSTQKRVTGSFNLPSGCSVQTLALVLRSSDEVSGVSGRVISAQIVPVNDGE